MALERTGQNAADSPVSRALRLCAPFYYVPDKSTTKSFDDNVRLLCLVTANIWHMGWGFLSYLEEIPHNHHRTHQHWQRDSIVSSHGCIASKNNAGLHVTAWTELAICSCPGKKFKLHSSLEQMALYRQQSHKIKTPSVSAREKREYRKFCTFLINPMHFDHHTNFCSINTRSTVAISSRPGHRFSISNTCVGIGLFSQNNLSTFYQTDHLPLPRQ